MALSKFEESMDIIQQLDDEPNDVGGLTADQLKAQFDRAGNLLKTYLNNTLTEELDRKFRDVYPVGSIYMSVNGTDPGTLFGGTWEQVKDRFLVGCGGSYPALSTGGAAEVTLTAEQMPAHRHGLHIFPTSTQAAGYGLTQAAPFADQVLIQNTAESSEALGTEAGGGQAHSNLPPYLAVYLWKRTA